MRPMPCLSAFAFALLTAAAAPAAGPVCALLDPDKAPRAALLEAKLLADPGATWVDRADIDKVLKEQKLQALFASSWSSACCGRHRRHRGGGQCHAARGHGREGMMRFLAAV